MTKKFPQSLVDEINVLDEQGFHTRIIEPSTKEWKLDNDDSITYKIGYARATALQPTLLDACFQLIEETSASAYRASSRGWQPKEKRAEMMDKDMRYLIVSDKATSEVIGFASYMFTIEDDYPVIYLYEVHLKQHLRGQGVGACLMRVVEDFGRIAKMEKLMLTVFTSNEGAERFYRSHGYAVDEYSPQPRVFRGGRTKRPDYLIMSKTLQ